MFQVIETAHAKLARFLQLEKKLQVAEDGHAHFWRDFDDALARFETDGRRFDKDWLIGEIVNVNDVLALCQICFHKDTIDVAKFVANLRRILTSQNYKNEGL